MIASNTSGVPARGVAAAGAVAVPVGRVDLSTGDGVPSGLADLVRRLAQFHVSSPALIVQAPDGEYRISPDGFSDGPDNRLVISRSQLGTLMWDHGLRRKDLSDARIAAPAAACVAVFEPRPASWWWSA